MPVTGIEAHPTHTWPTFIAIGHSEAEPSLLFATIPGHRKQSISKIRMS
jgi:hypothetical protein